MTELQKQALIYLLKDWGKSKGWVYSFVTKGVSAGILAEAHFTDEKGNQHKNVLITYDWVRNIPISLEAADAFEEALLHFVDKEDTLNFVPGLSMINASITARIMAHARMRGFTG